MSHPNDGNTLGEIAYTIFHGSKADCWNASADGVAAEVRRRDGDIVPKLNSMIEQKDRDIAAWRNQAQASQKKVTELAAEVERLKQCCANKFDEFQTADLELQRLKADYDAVEKERARLYKLNVETIDENTALRAKSNDKESEAFSNLYREVDILKAKAEGFDKLAKLNKSIEAESNALRSYANLQNITIAAQETSIEELRAEAKNRPNAELREFTRAAMQALSSTCDGYETKREDIALSAVKLAKATLAELAKEGAE